MKKAITLLIVLSIAFSLSRTNLFAAEQSYDYTVLIYMNGSDLESEDLAATHDLLEMIAADFGDNVAVIIETGGTMDWHTAEYGLVDISSTTNQRFRVLEDNLSLLESVGQKNMGEASTLEEFINYGMSAFPAAHYALLFWNHGGGAVNGFGSDENYDSDGLTIEEMDNALAGAYTTNHETFDIIGFDACLMGSLEMADMLSDYADYFIGSEELEPGHGWDYETVINTIVDNPQIEGDILGERIGQGFYTQSVYYDTEDTITVSVIDLSKIDLVKYAFEKLMSKVRLGLLKESLINPLIKIRLDSESYGEADSLSYGSDMVDIGDYAANLIDLYEEDATNVLEALEGAVLFNIRSKMKPDASGLSVYMPATNIREDKLEYALYIYKSMAFSSSYYDFLEDYSRILLSGVHDLSSDFESIEYTDIYADDDFFYMAISPEDLSSINEIYSTIGFIDADEDITYLGNDLIGQDNILDDGTIIAETVDYWATLEGHFVSLNFDGYDESGALYYYIPVMINHKDYDLLVLFSEEHIAGEIIGARPLMNPEANYYDRELIQIEPGDSVTLLYEYSAYNGVYYEYSGWYEGVTFIASEDMVLKWCSLDVGQYAYSFEFVDIYQNHYYSSWQLYDYFMGDVSYEEWLESFWDIMETNSSDVEGVALSNDELYIWLDDSLDVPSDWAYDYIDWAYYYGLTTKNTLTGFTEDITREEFCELVVNLYEVSTGEELTVTVNDIFTDTASTTVIKAFQLGIVNGYEDGTFRPNNEISREELIAMFYRTYCLLDSSLMGDTYDGLTYEDTYLISDWAVESCEFMVYWNLISGVGNNAIAPKDYATKEEALKLVTGVYEFYTMNNL
jgi:hypothetical protein